MPAPDRVAASAVSTRSRATTRTASLNCLCRIPEELGFELGLRWDLGVDALILVEDDEPSILVDPRAGDEVDHAVGGALLVLFGDLDRGMRLDLAAVPVVELGWIES